jgi:hypothetical protein
MRSRSKNPVVSPAINKLNLRAARDFLSISFSSNENVQHRQGPIERKEKVGMDFVFKRRRTYFPADKFHAQVRGKTSQSWPNKKKRKEIQSWG